MGRQHQTTRPRDQFAAQHRWWESAMAIAVNELDLAFLAPIDALGWQALGTDAAARVGGEARPTTADAGWNEVARELERDLVWAEVVALLEVTLGE